MRDDQGAMAHYTPLGLSPVAPFALFTSFALFALGLGVA